MSPTAPAEVEVRERAAPLSTPRRDAFGATASRPAPLVRPRDAGGWRGFRLAVGSARRGGRGRPGGLSAVARLAAERGARLVPDRLGSGLRLLAMRHAASACAAAWREVEATENPARDARLGGLRIEGGLAHPTDGPGLGAVPDLHPPAAFCGPARSGPARRGLARPGCGRARRKGHAGQNPVLRIRRTPHRYARLRS